MKYILLSSLIIIYFNSFSQVHTPPASQINEKNQENNKNAKIITFNAKLRNTKLILDAFSILSAWNLRNYLLKDDFKLAPRTTKQIIQLIDTFLLIKPSVNMYDGNIKEYNLIKKFKINIFNFLNDITFISPDLTGKFSMISESELPIKFGMYGDTALTMVLNGICSIENVYNTLRLTSNQRATKVATTYVRSIFSEIVKNFNTKEIKYYGIIIFYLSKDFSNDDKDNETVELLGIFSRYSNIKKYIDADITEEDFFNKSDIYITDCNILKFKKINLKIE